MIRKKSLWLALGLAAVLSVSLWASDPWAVPLQPGTEAIWEFKNLTGQEVTGLHIEFDRGDVQLTYWVGVFGDMQPLQGGGTDSSFTTDFGGLVSPYGSLYVQWTPVDAVPSLVMWMDGMSPVGAPFFTTISKLGYLFGQGIVAMREAAPEVLQMAFAQFFADNAEYLGTLSESLGMPLETALMPIIMSSPAEGIENFFNTIVGMLGIQSLGEVMGGGIDWTALFGALGL